MNNSGLGLSQSDFYYEYVARLIGDGDKQIARVPNKNLNDEDMDNAAKTAAAKVIKRYESGQVKSLRPSVLMLYAKLANVSIDQLFTEDVSTNITYRLHDLFRVLFTLLDATPMKVYEIQKHKDNSQTAHVIGIPIQKKYTPCLENYIIDEFLKQYKANRNTDNYEAWKQKILKGAYSYTKDGIKLDKDRKSSTIVGNIIDSCKKRLEADYQKRIV